MYLSRLRVEVGNDPRRGHPGERWLRNLYHVHQRLCMAFPSPPQASGNSGPNQVHVPREAAAGFLYRVDPGPSGKPVILVQSAVQPDWECAFHNARYLLVNAGRDRDPWEVKPFTPSFAADQCLRFRLVTNPTKKVGAIRQDERQRLTKQELKQKKGRHGRRIPVPSAAELSAWRNENPKRDAREYISAKLEAWLKSKAEPGGFSVQSVTVQPAYSYFKKVYRAGEPAPDEERTGGERGALLRSVRYEGILRVTDPNKFLDTLLRGVGPAKAFGFGLLSVARL